MIPSTSTPRSLESILDLNNHAVSYLCQGDHDATISTLRAAIKSLERCFQQEKLVHTRPTTSCSEEPPKKRRRSTATPTTSTRSSSTDSTEETSSVCVQKHGEYYVPIRSITVSDAASSSSELPSSTFPNDETSLLMVYDRAFDFASGDSTGRKDDVDFTSQQSKTRLAAILLYNLALSYHREGVRLGKSADLQLALRYYREAYMVLKSAWSKSDFKEVFVLLLALLNNMACIHAYMSDGKDTHQCINWMNRAIASRQRAILSKEDYTFFSLNLSVFHGHQLKLASAA